jgi:uncharacterized protein YpiB (UPF0302 family)
MNELDKVQAELAEIKELLIEQHKVINELSELLKKIPEAMEALGSNPMFKPFAKMLGL